MSQTQKRSAARDISDLKARLGLKRGGPKGGSPAATPGGIVPPPGARTGAIPAPPGMAPPRPQIPDASQDPFGAMNALAAHGTATRGPEIVVVNDGKPVENVEQKSKAARYGKIAAILLLPLILGMVVGEMSSSAKAYNQTIDDAARLKGDVDGIKSGLSEVQNQFLIARQRGPGGRTFLPNDEKLTTALASLDVSRPAPERVYRAFLNKLPKGAASKVYAFYTKSARFYEDLDAHVKQSKVDGKAIAAAKDKMAKMSPYGAYVTLPAAEDAANGAKPSIVLVELGQPVCEDRRQKPPCTPAGFNYRKEPTGPWGTMDIAAPQSGQIASDKLLPIKGNAIFTALLSGSDATVAQAAYMARVGDLAKQLDELIKLGNEVEKILKAEASEGKRFTFFM
ncbi:MAG TPA: hypothetical protein VFG83_02370 [Kofleriaceae bacterium]|nr:hypothetical protein [Kofleriaceae bacterium]